MRESDNYVIEVTSAEKAEVPFRLAYLPCLDGVRGLAVTAVLLFHLGLPYTKGGFLGVDVFFVLSGFLISSILLQEWDATNRIRFVAFYGRRIYRLLPALLFLLLMVCLYAFFRQSPDAASNTYYTAGLALCYQLNWAIIYGRPTSFNGALGHLWSLSVEEQFYLIWPAILGGMLRFRVSIKRISLYVLVGILITFADRLMLLWLNSSEARRYNGSDTRADALLVGCLVALLYRQELLPKSSNTLMFLWIIPLGTVTAFFFFGFPKSYGTIYMHSWGFTMSAIAFAVVLVQLLGPNRMFLHRILEFRPLVVLGQMSYGVYLWHLPIFQVVSGQWTRLLLTTLVSALSFYILERPILRLGKKYLIPKRVISDCQVKAPATAG